MAEFLIPDEEFLRFFYFPSFLFIFPHFHDRKTALVRVGHNKSRGNDSSGRLLKKKKKKRSFMTYVTCGIYGIPQVTYVIRHKLPSLCCTATKPCLCATIRERQQLRLLFFIYL